MQISGKQINLIYDINKAECTYAFRDMDISLNPREFVGIKGLSGCGKSSLLYVLSGMRKPTSGAVYYNDVDIESYSFKEKAKIRKSMFGFIFQKHFLIEYLTVLENVMTGVDRASDKTKEKAMSLLESLKISHLSERQPGQLSCGQKQRVAIARALINDPEVIFADEPTASLDHNSAQEVIRVLEKLKSRSTIIIATHDPTILQNADRIIQLWDGHPISNH